MALGIFIGCFFVVTYIYQEFLSSRLFTYITNIYSPEEGDFWVSFTIIFLLSFYLAYFIFVLITHINSRPVLLSFYFFYFITLIYFLFFKSIGIRGISLNPLDFLWGIGNGEGTIETLFNIIYFIPLGFLVGKKIISFLIFIVLVEIVQYTFSLGIFDLSDILLNFIGFYIGLILQKTFLYKLFSLQLKKSISTREQSSENV
ncbi:VanZ family protein [Candidatus Enterococcus dunnyi]